ncbi:MAG: hypothetical protein GY943_04240, partial [Chloroflexi bacterium]|nr:hypothetical protein [Chloroflexota bacterium]
MTDSIRLYLDEDTISRALIRALRARQIDILTAQEAGMLGQSDDVQLAFSTEGKRVVLTFNTQDFAQLHKSYLDRGQLH